ncbi:MAG: hypothetical protein RSB55_04275 [Oscillospiraceae bacterium]
MGWTAEERDGQVLVTVWRDADSAGLYKAYLQGGSGRFLLGTLAPEGGRLAITRRVPKSRLAACGAWPILGAETPLEFVFPRETLPKGWERPKNLPVFCDGFLRELAENAPGGWLARRTDGFRLSYPWGGNRPFPLAPLFCFASLETLGGDLRAVYCFTSAGVPVIPHDR